MASKYDWNVTHSQEDVTAEIYGIPGFLLFHVRLLMYPSSSRDGTRDKFLW